MKIKLLALIALAAGSVFAQTRFSVGVNIGGGYRPHYYAPAPVYVAPSYVAPAYGYDSGYDSGYVAEAPPYPGPGYTWIDGYWSNPGYGRRAWVAGFWRAPVARFGYRNESPRYERFERGGSSYGRSSYRGSSSGRSAYGGHGFRGR